MAGIRAASDGRAKNARELDVPSWSWSVFDQLIEWSWTGDGDIDVPSATQNGNSTSRMDGISPLDTEKNSTSTLHQNWSENTTMRSDSISPPNTTATSILDLHQIRSDKLMPSSTDVHLCSTSSSHGLTATTGDCWPAGSTHELYRIIYLYTGEFCSTASELYSGLQASPLFRKHKVLAIFSVDENVWEILMPAGYVLEFCNCIANFGFAIERNSAPKPGFCMRALIIWMYSRDDLVGLIASSYISFLKLHSFQDVIRDILRTRVLFPESFVMAFKSYRRVGLRYSLER